MKNYLTIGDLAKLKGVSVKALRYYEKIGILKPDYINPVNNYRYYHPKQAIKIDFILSLLELNVPLKNFHNYIADDTLDVNKLLTESNELIEQELLKLQRIKKKINNMYVSVMKSTAHNLNEPYQKDFPKRYLLVEPVAEPAFMQHKYIEQISRFYNIIGKKGYTALYQHGIMSVNENGCPKFYIFVEIEKPKQQEKLLFTIPSGRYNCIIRQQTLDIEEFFVTEKADFMLLIERWTPYTNEQNILLETQLLAK